MKHPVLIILLAGLIPVLSASSCNPEHDCTENYINPAFIGFSPPEIDSFILRRYQPGGNFQHLLDTMLVTDKNASIYTRSNDTTVVYINSSAPGGMIRSPFDWQLYLPAKNKTVTISRITSMQVENKGRVCYNPITSFSVDGQSIAPVVEQTGQLYTGGYRVYIRN